MKYGFIKTAAAVPTVRVADPEKNADSIISCMKEAEKAGADVLVFPELCLSGYTCGDLFLQDILVNGCERALERIIDESENTTALTVVGLPVKKDGKLYDCAAVIYGGELLGLVPKAYIANYGEFYEARAFSPAPKQLSAAAFCGTAVPFGTDIIFRHVALPEAKIAVEIGGDMLAPVPVSAESCINGATVIANPAAMAALAARDDKMRETVKNLSARLVCGYIRAGAGWGESTQDLVFAGDSIISENGIVLKENSVASGIIYSEIDVKKLSYERGRTGMFGGSEDNYFIADFGGEMRDTSLTREFSDMPFIPKTESQRVRRCERILSVQAMGLARRIEHTWTKKLVIGVSGGLDSTLAMLVAVRALELLGRPASDLIAVTMPCFGTTKRTRSNAELLAERLGAELRTVDITESVKRHFEDIGHDINVTDVVFENSQARERTQVLMDIANGCGGMVVGTGDLSELALGWATYNGDHMSMYGVNCDVPKTLVRYLVSYYADTCEDVELSVVLRNILDTPVSPELLPAENGEISQKTEDLVGPYELHDFFLYWFIRWGCEPDKIYHLAKHAFSGKYDNETILKWLKTFMRRFFAQQFKRSCVPDGPKVGSVALSPRGDWRMPSDAVSTLWLDALEGLN